MTITTEKKFIPSPKLLADSNKERLSCGHRMCPGCTLGVILKAVLSSTEDPVIVVSATGCLEICTGAFPFTSWQTPWIHSLFENSASVASGLDALKKAWERKGILNEKQKKIKILAMGGDGASYDIGFQWISGALERGHDFVYLCTDNEGYMNTGYQRSSATPWAAHTSTTPIGTDSYGKINSRKNITEIFAAHHIPYIAQSSPSHFSDLAKKAHKAFHAPGPAFLNVLSSCTTNWKFPPEKSLEVLDLAVKTNFWPLYEVEQGNYKINFENKHRKPIKDWLSIQGRFKHIMKNPDLLERVQEQVDDNFSKLKIKATTV